MSRNESDYQNNQYFASQIDNNGSFQPRAPRSNSNKRAAQQAHVMHGQYPQINQIEMFNSHNPPLSQPDFAQARDIEAARSERVQNMPQ